MNSRPNSAKFCKTSVDATNHTQSKPIKVYSDRILLILLTLIYHLPILFRADSEKPKNMFTIVSNFSRYKGLYKSEIAD